LVLAAGAAVAFAHSIVQHRTCQAKVANQSVSYEPASNMANITFTYMGGCGGNVRCIGEGAGADQSYLSGTGVCRLRVPAVTTAQAGVLAGGKRSYPLLVACHRQSGTCTITKRPAS
jgi:hypothetical protein